MSDQTKCCCEVAAMIADVYERLLKAEEWNRYQNEKHTECADRLLEAQDRIRELEELVEDVRVYLVAASDGSMSRNNSEQLASELLERVIGNTLEPPR